MHFFPRRNVMLDFIWTLPVQLRGTWNKWTLQKNLVHGRIRSTNTASRLQVHRSHHSTTTRLIWDGIKCPWNLLIRSINKLEKVHVCIASTICQFQPYNVRILLKTVTKYLHWQSAKQYRCYITVTGLGKIASCRCMHVYHINNITAKNRTGIPLIFNHWMNTRFFFF